MNYHEIGSWISTLIAFAFGWTWWGNFRNARKYRKLWIEAERQRSEVAAERDQWTKTAWQNHEALAQEKTKRAGMKKIISDQASEMDSLVHGDKLCANGHRFYLGEVCPHCAAKCVGDITNRTGVKVEGDPMETRCSVCMSILRFGDEIVTIQRDESGYLRPMCKTCAERTQTIKSES